jgi:hypothetical protein
MTGQGRNDGARRHGAVAAAGALLAQGLLSCVG